MKKLNVILMSALLVTMAIFFVSAMTVTEKQQFVGSDSVSGDILGFGIVVDGGVGVSGARFHSLGRGAVYVLNSSGDEWVEVQKLTASDGAPFQFFGFGISIQGNMMVIGATNARNGVGVASGAAYVFEKINGEWVETQKLSDSIDGSMGDSYGISIALQGDTLIIGAGHGGVVHVYKRIGSTWVEDEKILPSDTADLDRFGTDLALEGETLLVGAPKSGFIGSGTGPGSAYIFERSGGTWNEKAKLTAGVDKDMFGFNVDLFGNTAVIGAPQQNLIGMPATGAGSVYVYKKSDNIWNLQATLTASDGAFGDRFGGSVSILGNMIVSGATFHDGARGAVYKYIRSGNIWTETDKLIASDAIQGTALGEAVEIAGDEILVGASNLDYSIPSPRPNVGPGAVYVYDK